MLIGYKMFARPAPKMEDEIIEHLRPHEDQWEQQRSLAFIEQIKTAPDAWRKCMGWIMKGGDYPENFEFFCLQVIADFALHDYRGTDEELRLLQDFLSYWIQSQCNQNGKPRPSYFGNKVAQIFTAVFVREYPTTWRSFFVDLVKSLSLGVGAIDYYLRILLAINEEVTHPDIPRGQKEIFRNNLIKTAMRESDLDLIVESWYQILKFQTSEERVTKKCLDVISSYVSWINIDLIANVRFIEVLLSSVESAELRESAVQVLLEIVKKGMEPVAKLQLIESLLPVMSAAHIFDVEENDDSDFPVKVASLVSTIGLTLMEAHKTLQKNGMIAEANVVEESIESKVPLMIMFLGNEYDDVSTAVLPFTRDYIQMLKQKVFLADVQLANVHSIIGTVIRKMKYDVEYNFDYEGEDEAEFIKYRKLLKVIFENLAGLNRELVTDQTMKYVLGTMGVWRESTFHQVEAALALMYLLGESVPATVQSGAFHLGADAPSHIQRMMRALVESGVSHHGHPRVTLQFFETVVRFEKFFEAEPEHLQSLLAAFLDVRGLHHPSCKVRSRCAYLFLKLVKALKSCIQPYAVDLLRPLQGVLVLCLPEDGTGYKTDAKSWVGRDDQLYLYEAAALIIVSSSCPPATKAEAFRDLLNPAFTKFSNIVAQLAHEADPERYENLTVYLAHVISVTCRSSKAFANYQHLKANACVSIYTHSIHVFLPSLQIPHSSAIVKSTLRQFLHRMVVCLEDNLLPFFVQATEGLLRDNDLVSIQEYLPLLVQVITKFKKEVLPFLQRAFVPIARHVFAALASNADEEGENVRYARLLLHRNYFGMIYAISYHDLIDTLKAQEPAFMEEVQLSVVRGAGEFHDLIAQKCCFAILRQFVTMWGGDAHFTDFIYTHIVPACFLVPLHRDFDLSDAQSGAVLNEIAMCMRLIYDLRSNELITYLKHNTGSKFGIQPEDMEKYCVALSGEAKVFKSCIRMFFTAVRK